MPSNLIKRRYVAFALRIPWLCLVLFSTGSVHARPRVDIKVLALSPSVVEVHGRLEAPVTSWVFPASYAGINRLNERVSKLKLIDTQGVPVPFRDLGGGRVESSRPVAGFDYEMTLAPPGVDTDASHVSWLTAERGILILDDILPLESGNSAVRGAEVFFDLPVSWKVFGNGRRLYERHYQINDVHAGIFAIAPDLSVTEKHVAAMNLALVSSQGWAFSDSDAIDLASAVLSEEAKIIGGPPGTDIAIILMPFPRAVAASRWSAETRGSTVVLLSGKWPSSTPGLAQLSVPLRHELFHLWVPNALSLEGNYDWFYEGFTTYEATRVGVDLGHLTFAEFLDALGRESDNYLRSSPQNQLSLLEASKKRWSGGASDVYHKATLIAYLYDLTLRYKSRGSNSLERIYRALFRLHNRSLNPEDGNSVVLSALNAGGLMRNFVRQYIETTERIDLPALLAPFGLRVEEFGGRSHISPVESLTRAQRDLLSKMGYNKESPQTRRR